MSKTDKPAEKPAISLRRSLRYRVGLLVTVAVAMVGAGFFLFGVKPIVDRVADVLERTALHCDTVSRDVFARKAAGGGAEGPARDLEAMLGRSR